jgi:YegS/Rv2252/BmrU family lipid kinase
MVRLPFMTGQTPPRQVTILANPAARGFERFHGATVVRWLERRGIDARLVVPASTSRAAEDAARRGDDLVFVVGGDGTQREAATGLAGSATALAPIPAGTTNVLAKELGIPDVLRDAFEAHISGQRVAMDLGRANGQTFLLMASAGWDAMIVQGVNPGLKARTGQFAYGLQTLLSLHRLRSGRATFSSGLAHWDVSLGVIVVSNTRLYGGLVVPSPEARANDGLLDVCALCPRWPGEGIRLAARLVTHRLGRDVRAVTGRLGELMIETPGIPFQLDGDYAGETPLRIEVEPGVLQVSVPAGRLPAIFRTSATGER